MNRAPVNGSVTYLEARRMYASNRWMIYEYNELKSFRLEPDGDWNSAIREYAKISLDGSKVYEIKEKIVIENPAYIIGNGAKIRFTSKNAGIFFRSRRDNVPMFDFEENVILDCVFERGCEEPNVCVESNTPFIVQNCVFINMYGICIKANSSCTVRGSHFVASYCGIKTSNNFSRVALKACTFEKCLIGIQTNGIEVFCYDTVFINNLCSLFAKQHLTCRNCTFVINERDSVPFTCGKLCDCTSGHAVPLANIHIAKAKQLQFPVFTHCSFIRCRLYLGNRNNVFHPEGCNFLHSTLLLQNATSRVLCMTGLFADTSRVKKLLRRSSGQEEKRWCLCGDQHDCPIPLSNDITSVVKVNREFHSVDSSEFIFSDSD